MAQTTIRLADLVAASARRHPDSPALTAQATTISYATLCRQLERAAAGLRELELEAGDRIAIYLDKRVETVAAMLGCSLAGCVFVPVNPVLRTRQVGHIIEDCAAKVLVTSADRLRALRAELDTHKSLRHVLVLGEPLGDDEDRHYRVQTWSGVAERR